MGLSRLATLHPLPLPTRASSWHLFYETNPFCSVTSQP